jgi:hypothetical protein
LLRHRRERRALSVNADQLTYHVGDTITLSISGDDEGASAYGCFGRLLYRGDIVDNGTRSPEGGSHSVRLFTKGALSAIGQRSRCIERRVQPGQRHRGSPDQHPEANPFATVTLIAVAVGVVDVEWDTTAPTRSTTSVSRARPARRSRSCPSPRQLCCSASAWSC